MNSDSLQLPRRLVTLVRGAFPGRAEAVRLVQGFWRYRRAYERKYSRTLIEVATGRCGHDWEDRCLAALILQHQWVCLPLAAVREHSYLLWTIGLKKTFDSSGPVADLVLSEGYTTTRLIPFLREFRRRLTRRMWLHRELRRERPPLRTWQSFFLLSSEECSIELTRYLFTASEVAERIVSSLRISEGSPAPPLTPLVPQESAATLQLWPPFERAITERLTCGRDVYWSTGATPGQLNALVSRPPGTVVVVVKPPGSRLEIEIKRTGTSNALPLAVAYERSARQVPRSHRLDGGSMTLSLRFEAAAAATYATVYRSVWHRPAPIPISLAVRFVDTLPVRDRAEHIIDYFTNEDVFGDDFLTMRSRLALCVEAFEYEGCSGLPELESDRGRTVRFLHYTAPGQAVLAGTTKFRLSVLAQFLEPLGADNYFRNIADAAPRVEQARQLADTLMEEILGSYHPPRDRYRGHAQYLNAAFSESRNRTAANLTFRSLMRQLGKFWGTMLAIRGHSFGESLVARNVGLTTDWVQGRWRVKLVFMDHDNLYLPAPDLEHFHSEFVLDGTSEDWNYAIGHSKPGDAPVSLVDFLKQIYRVQSPVAAEGDDDLRRSLAHAYRRARRALDRRSELRRLFSPEFRRASSAWDRKVALHLAQRSATSGASLRANDFDAAGNADRVGLSDGAKNQTAFGRHDLFVEKLYGIIFD